MSIEQPEVNGARDPIIESMDTIRATISSLEATLTNLKQDRVKNAGLIERTELRLAEERAKLQTPEEK